MALYDRMTNGLYHFLLWGPGVFMVLLLCGMFGS